MAKTMSGECRFCNSQAMLSAKRLLLGIDKRSNRTLIFKLRFYPRTSRETGFPVNCQRLTHGWVSELGTYRKSDFLGSSRDHFLIANDSGFAHRGQVQHSEAAFSHSGPGEIALDLATIL
jgi:hypothetical protein